jgi:beta-galactosidase
MKNGRIFTKLVLIFLFLIPCENEYQTRPRTRFCRNWRFHKGDLKNAEKSSFDDSDWRMLDLPLDRSVEGRFSKEHPAPVSAGALPAGIGWYRKHFKLTEHDKHKLVFIDFDGVDQNSSIWKLSKPIVIKCATANVRLSLKPVI